MKQSSALEEQFQQLRDSHDMVAIKEYLDIYHTLRRLPLTQEIMAAEVKLLFQETRAIKRDIQKAFETEGGGKGGLHQK